LTLYCRAMYYRQKAVTVDSMKTMFILIALLVTACLAGCSSVSMPSLPWSGSTVKPDPTAEALYDEGTRYFTEKRYARAIDAWTKIKTDYPFSPQLTDVELKIADAYYLNQQYPEAINGFKEFQSLHPTNENIAFVVYRLGQAHLDQFTSIERDQKNTEIAKTYFETVITNYPKSPYAIEAKEQLAKCVGYLAEHDFNVASFYLKQEKYPAARDRFEAIVRKYPGTPVAARSLFFLGESYRKEKNNVKAALAYEALLQYYPESKLAPEAKAQLDQLEKDKQDPLSMLLMRDRRPGAATTPESGQATANNDKLKDVNNLVAKTEVVYEEPGEEKGVFSKVVEKINPFSSSDNGKKQPESATALAMKKNASEKDQSPGVLGSLWNGINPFGGQSSKTNKTNATAKSAVAPNVQLVNQIDDSLKQKGIDSETQTAALNPPAAALPKENTPPPPQTMDTGKLLGDIDMNLQKAGKDASELPPPPEAAPAFKDPAAAEIATAKAKAAAKPDPQQSAEMLSGIDQKLKSQGFEPAKLEAPLTPSSEVGEAPKKEPTRNVELEPKMAVDKGPLFLAPTEIPAQGKAAATENAVNPEKKPESSEKQPAPGDRDFSRQLVKGPVQSPTPTPVAKTAEQKRPAPGDEDESKGIFDQLKDDVENVHKLLNPFQW
jgi:outer membrane protein assembly factor BamD